MRLSVGLLRDCFYRVSTIFSGSANPFFAGGRCVGR